MIAIIINGSHYSACIWYGWKLGYWKSGKVRLRALLIISEGLDLVRCCWVFCFFNCRQYQLILLVGSLWGPHRLLAYKFPHRLLAYKLKFLPAGQRWSGSHFMPALHCHSESRLHTKHLPMSDLFCQDFWVAPLSFFFFSFFFSFSFCCFCLQLLLESGRVRGSFLFVLNTVYLLLLPVMPVFLWCSCTLLLLSSRNKNLTLQIFTFLYFGATMFAQNVFGPSLRYLPWPSFRTHSNELMQLSLWIQLSHTQK